MLIKLAWRNLWRNKLRTGIMLGAIVFGLTGVVTMMGFMSGMVDNMVHNAIAWQTSHIQVHNRKFIENPDITSVITDADSIVQKIKHRKEVKQWSARFIVDGMIGSARSNRGVKINGIDSQSETEMTPLSENIRQGEWLTSKGRNPVLVSEKIAARLRLKIGSKVVLTFTDGTGQVTGAAFRMGGIFKTPSTVFDDANVFVRIDDLRKVARMEGYHEIAVLLNDELDYKSRTFMQGITDLIQQGSNNTTQVRDWTQIQPLLASMIATMDVSNAIMLGIFVTAMGFGIVNIMLMSVFERTREFGVLMAVGMPGSSIFSLIMLESVWLGICGAGLGILACLILMAVLQVTGLPLGSMAEGLGAYGVDTVLYPRVSAFEYQIIFLTVVLSSILASVYPAWQILKKNSAQAMAERH